MSEGSQEKKKKGGRPPKYTRAEVLSWEEEFIEKSKDGMSERAFMGSKGCNRSYFDERAARDVPELSSIREKARCAREEYYRKLIIAGSVGKIKGFQLGGFVWLTKHILGWFDVAPEQTVDLSLGAASGGPSKVTFTTSWGSSLEPSDKKDE